MAISYHVLRLWTHPVATSIGFPSLFSFRHRSSPFYMAPSSSATETWNYDVFLSFRGEDTREGFTGFLYDALVCHGFVTFIDEQLRRGDSISDQLIGVIEQSRASIVVFSENYASSGWCLDELAKIMEWKKEKKQKVWPVFYRVDPSEVRHQRGRTEEHLLKHAARLGEDSERVEDCAQWSD